MLKIDNVREFLENVKGFSQLNLANKWMVGSLMNKLATKKFD